MNDFVCNYVYYKWLLRVPKSLRIVPKPSLNTQYQICKTFLKYVISLFSLDFFIFGFDLELASICGFEWEISRVGEVFEVNEVSSGRVRRSTVPKSFYLCN